MPKLGDGLRTAGDIGMYAQTLLPSLAAPGFHSIPQTILGMYADVVPEALGLSYELNRLSFGESVVLNGIDD